MGTLRQGGVSAVAGGPGVTSPVSLQTTWIDMHDNVSATAETSTILVTPLTYTSSGNVALIHPIKVAQGTRIALRGKYPVGTTTITTSPTVRIYALDTLPSEDGVFPAGTQFWRLDNDSAAGPGLTITLDATNDLRDGTFKYSMNGPSLLTYDMFGAACLLALHDTAAVISGGANTTVQIQVSILN